MSETHSDPWRYRCPNNHASWERYPGNRTPGEYYCESCDEYFDELVDLKRESKTGAKA